MRFSRAFDFAFRGHSAQRTLRPSLRSPPSPLTLCTSLAGFLLNALTIASSLCAYTGCACGRSVRLTTSLCSPTSFYHHNEASCSAGRVREFLGNGSMRCIAKCAKQPGSQ
eukprot:2593957-Rhodomonas_salina.3